MASKDFNLLGKSNNTPPAEPSAEILDTFPNRHTKRDYLIEFHCSDFTSRCPITQQSDFAEIHIQYIPDEACIETKSLKFYLQSYRAQNRFNEQIVNSILEDLVAACSPKWMRVKGEFAPRGGISVVTIAEHPDDDLRENLYG